MGVETGAADARAPEAREPGDAASDDLVAAGDDAIAVDGSDEADEPQGPDDEPFVEARGTRLDAWWGRMLSTPRRRASASTMTR